MSNEFIEAEISGIVIVGKKEREEWRKKRAAEILLAGGSLQVLLTGSRAYGKPRDDSDYDLVILVDEATFIALEDLQASPKFNTIKSSQDNGGVAEIMMDREFEDHTGYGGLNIKQGKLNLIVEMDVGRFDDWVTGTADLISRSPVTKEEAIRVFDELKKKRKKKEAAIEEIAK